VAVEYVPAGQGVQAAVAALGAKDPAGQLTHAAAPASDAVPGAQALQLLLLASGCAEPAGQGVQAAAPAPL
jgi:hypothetical protein